MANERRQLLRLGALFLFLATLMGVVLAAGAPNPTHWKSVHVSTILVGLTLIGQGLVWSDLRLSDGQRRVAFTMARISAGTVLLLGLSAAVLNIPGPVSAPGVTPQGIQTVVLVSLLLLIVPTTIGSTFLVWKGLGGD